MLLYHFPLNTQESIENFTNKGIKNDWYYKDNNRQTTSANGKISNICCLPNESRVEIPINSDTFTLAFRVFLSTDTSVAAQWRTFISIVQGTTRVTAFIIYSNLTYYYWNAITDCRITQLNKWCDVVLVVDKGKYTGYFNGVKTGNTVTISGNVDKITLYGRNDENGHKFNLPNQDVRIYDHALSQAEINEYSRALVVHYPLQGNELNPSVLKDVSGFGNDIILKADDCFNTITDFVRGNKIQQCRSKFLGTDMRQSGGTAYGQTISLWVRQNFATGSMSGIWTYLFTHRIYDGENSDFSYLANGAGRQALWNNKNSISMPLTAGNLYHIAIVYNGTTRKIYANGSVYNTSNVPLNSFNINYILMGNGGNAARYDKCISIVDYRIYATALSVEDIKNLYNSPIAVSKQHQSLAFEFNENPLYPSKYWRTPMYNEMKYILSTRTNASNLKLLGRVNVNGTYIKGCFLLPDDWVLPAGISMTITIANFTTNSYSLEEFKKLENAGAVFFPYCYIIGININTGIARYWLSSSTGQRQFDMNDGSLGIGNWSNQQHLGEGVRLCRTSQDSHSFGTSATTKIRFAKSNLQYHCTQHLWRFAEHSYDYIGTANTNRSDSYDGWIDLFGYGTSGVNYRPTQNSTDDSNYASGDIANTDNDWGINEIQSYDYNIKNFALNKNGIVQHNELIEGSADGCYQDKLITNELLEQ